MNKYYLNWLKKSLEQRNQVILRVILFEIDNSQVSIYLCQHFTGSEIIKHNHAQMLNKRETKQKGCFTCPVVILNKSTLTQTEKFKNNITKKFLSLFGK